MGNLIPVKITLIPEIFEPQANPYTITHR
jgi:hypothetical protein